MPFQMPESFAHIFGIAGGKVQSRLRGSAMHYRWPIPKNHIAIMMREKLATNMTMEVNAAMSRMISVICALLTRYVSFLFYFCSRVNGSFDEFVAISFKVFDYG
jgi:hypothetical protein